MAYTYKTLKVAVYDLKRLIPQIAQYRRTRYYNNYITIIHVVIIIIIVMGYLQETIRA